MRGDDDLRRAFSELEAAVPTASASLEPSTARRKAPWAVVAAVVAVAIVTGFIIAGSPRSDAVGQPTPSMTPSMSVPASATPSEATTAPSPSSPPPAWVVAPHDLDVSPGQVVRMMEARGVLFAVGSTEDGQPAIWHSQDGRSWTAAAVPVVEEEHPGGAESELGGTVRRVVDVGERLVALATLNTASGPGNFGTKVYVSDDGSAWDEVTATPGVLSPSGRPMYDLAVAGSRIVAAGEGVWISDDGGLSWTDATDAALFDTGASTATFDTVVVELEARGDLLIAVGGSPDPHADVGPGETYAWVSRDEGTSWDRHSLQDADPATYGTWPRAVEIDESGTIMIIGWSLGVRPSDPGVDTPIEQVMWRSEDLGETWNLVPHPDVECCVLDIVAIPTGFASATYETTDAGEASVSRSADGSDWTVEDPGVNPRAIAWTPTFGLVVLGDDSIAFSRDPAP